MPPATSLPSGPRRPGSLQLLELMLRPFDLLDRCSERFGGCFTLRPRYFPPLVVVSDPEDVRAVFAADPPRSTNGGAESALDPNRLMQSVFGETSFVFREGADLDEHRRLLAPTFSRRATLERSAAIAEAVEGSIDSWPRGRSFRLHPRIKTLVLRILICATVGFTERRKQEQAERFTLELLEATDNPVTLLALSLSQRGSGSPLRHLPSARAALAARESLLQLYADEAGRRRRAPLEADESLLGHVVAEHHRGSHNLSDREIGEMLHSMILGHETAAAGISWTLADILYESKVRDRLQVELEEAIGDERPSLAELSDLPYLRGVVQESLRRHPVLGWVWRTLNRPLALSGHLIPAGTVVLPTLHLAHADPRRWPHPRAFRPQRFMDGDVDPATFFPFGGGRHGCPGAGMAVPLIQYVVVRTLQRLELEAGSAALPGIHLDVATCSPADGLLAVAEDREPAGRRRAAVTEAGAPSADSVCPTLREPGSS